METRRILVIAGSDSSGGAGLEADQKVIAAHGCYAMTATTALTAQNTTGVFGIHETPPDFVKKQIDLVLDDVGVDIVKTGMLASEETIKIVAESMGKWKPKHVVVDPVMVSTSGSQLLPEAAVEALIQQLLPLTTVLTPNLPEAKLILRTAGVEYTEPETPEDLIAMASKIHNLGPASVYLKGGHLPFTSDRLASKSDAENHLVINVLYDDTGAHLIESPHQTSRNTHGTGCSLASAIASNLALGNPLLSAIRSATRYVEAGIATAADLGKGSGPINHFHSLQTLPFPPGGFVDHLLSRPDVQEPWQAHTQHAFVQGMADGSLPLANFQTYMVQDYLFLVHFARAHALAAYKARDVRDVARSAKILSGILGEMKLHVAYCAEFGIGEEEIAGAEERQACTAYTRFILDTGHAEDWFGLQVALLPCLLGYGVIARRVMDDPASRREGNPYWKWVEWYVDEEYVQGVRLGRALIEEHAVKQSPSRIEELVKIFIHATKMETGFWEMGASAE